MTISPRSPSPAASPPGGASRPPPARCSRNACSSSAARTPMSSSKMPTSQAAAKVAATARMVNGGQSCIAGKRFIVVRSIARAVSRRRWSRRCAATRWAIRRRKAPSSARWSERQGARRDPPPGRAKASRKGARLLLGGKVPDRPGAWYPATVLTDVRPGQPAHDEEVFGPVAAIIAAEDEADAIRIANDSEFGLGSGVLTADLDRGRRIAAEELEAGMSFVNENVRSDPRTPFGGVKHSGLRPRMRRLRHPRVRQHQDGAREAARPATGCAHGIDPSNCLRNGRNRKPLLPPRPLVLEL